MSRAAEDRWAAVRAAAELPFGPSRTATLRRLVADGDAAGVEEVAAAARIALLESYAESGDHPAMLDPFDWLLERYDDAPEWLGEGDRRSILWAFRWVTVGALDHPEVPRERIESGLERMAERYLRTGAGEAPVLACRYAVTAALEGEEAAHPAFLAWTAVPRSELSDCHACEVSRQAAHLAAIGRHDEAVRTGRPVLDGELTCQDEPGVAIAELLASLLIRGDTRRAAAEHVRGVRLLRDAPVGRHHGRHLAVCARAGRLDRGLTLLERWLPRFDADTAPDRTVLDDPAEGGTPIDELWFATDATRLLRGLIEQGRGGLVVRPRGAGDGPARETIAELEARLSERAERLAKQFDARNGTRTVGTELAIRLTVQPLPDLPVDPIDPAGTRLPVVAAASVPAYAEVPTGDPAALAAAGDVDGLAAALDATARAESDPARLGVLAAWRLVRGLYANKPQTTEPRGATDEPDGPGEPGRPAGFERASPLSVARLDAALAVEQLLHSDEETGRLLGAAADAAERLRTAGAPVEALLHEQAAQLAAVQADRIDPAVAVERVAQLAAQAVREVMPGDAGVALSRLVAARQLAGDDTVALPEPEPDGTGPIGLPGEGTPPDGTDLLGSGEIPLAPRQPLDATAAALASPVTTGIELLESVPVEMLDHQQRRALARLLRVRAGTEAPERAIDTLRLAIAVLPPGVRPRERAMTGADLATTMQATDLNAALAAWDSAIADAAATGDDGLVGTMFAAVGRMRHTVGDVGGAVESLARAVPLLARHTDPLLASQARFDLARALLDAERAPEAAELAETALEAITDRLAAAGAEPVGPGLPPPVEDDPLERVEVHLAGCTAFAAAEASGALGESEHARDLAERSAGWHRRNSNLIAEAESWQLAARCASNPGESAAALERAAELADAGGDWARAATCRREQATAVHEAAGAMAALAVVEDAQARLEARATAPTGRHAPTDAVREAKRQLTWHRLALTEQRVRLLALARRFPEALEAVHDLDAGYREVDDAWSARDVLALRGQIRAELKDFDGGLQDLQDAAAEALAAGDVEQARGLAMRLAAVLDENGRPDEAEKAWRRFSGEE